MPFNGTGTFTRLENWSNDATNNLPISATKFDIEDNDFASGLSLCLTRDGQGVPSAALTWSQQLTLNRGSDGTTFSTGRTGGVNNPALSLAVADAANTVAISLTTAGIVMTFGQSPNFVTAPSLNLTSTVNPTNGLYLPSANTLGFATNGLSRMQLDGSGQLSLTTLANKNPFIITSANGNTYGVTDFEINRNGSTANTLQMGPNVTLADLTNNNATVLQNSGGQTELWQDNAASWQQLAFWNTSRSLTLNAPASGAFALKVFGNSTASNSEGVLIQAGTNTNDLALSIVNQAGTSNLFRVSGNGQVQALGPTAAALVDMTPDTGTFTAGITGLTTNPTGTATWARVGKVIICWLPALSGVSNSTACTITGFPAAICPTSVVQNVGSALVLDNSVAAYGAVQMASGGGAMNLLKNSGTTFAVTFTNGGNKGIPAGAVIAWQLN